jgi:hypothetical protein
VDFEFFAFLIFMSFVSFAVAFLAYAMVVRFMGKASFASRVSQIILVPACIVIYDFITIATPSGYRYMVGALPLLLCAGLALYYRFVKGADFANEGKTPTELAQVAEEPKKFSKKSARIHEARKNRGRR